MALEDNIDERFAGGPTGYYRPEYGLLAIQDPQAFIAHMVARGERPPAGDFGKDFTSDDAHKSLGRNLAPAQEKLPVFNPNHPDYEKSQEFWDMNGVPRPYDPNQPVGPPTPKPGDLPVRDDRVADANNSTAAWNGSTPNMIPQRRLNEGFQALGFGGDAQDLATEPPAAPGTGAPAGRSVVDWLRDVARRRDEGATPGVTTGPNPPDSMGVTTGPNPPAPPPVPLPVPRPVGAPRAETEPPESTTDVPASPPQKQTGGLNTPDEEGKFRTSGPLVKGTKKTGGEDPSDSLGKALAGLSAFKPPAAPVVHTPPPPRATNQLSRSNVPQMLLQQMSQAGHPTLSLRLGQLLRGG